MQEVQQSKEKTLVSNRTLAEQNLTLQPRLEHKKEQLTKRYSCLQEKFESYQLRKSTLGTAAWQQEEKQLLMIGSSYVVRAANKKSSWRDWNRLRVLIWCF